MQFDKFSPDDFTLARLPFSYDPKAQCPLFKQFLLDFSNGYQDRVEWKIAWLHALVTNRIKNQVF